MAAAFVFGLVTAFTWPMKRLAALRWYRNWSTARISRKECMTPGTSREKRMRQWPRVTCWRRSGADVDHVNICGAADTPIGVFTDEAAASGRIDQRVPAGERQGNDQDGGERGNRGGCAAGTCRQRPGGDQRRGRWNSPCGGPRVASSGKRWRRNRSATVLLRAGHLRRASSWPSEKPIETNGIMNTKIVQSN
jgi:hypothetical protein